MNVLKTPSTQMKPWNVAVVILLAGLSQVLLGLLIFRVMPTGYGQILRAIFANPCCSTANTTSYASGADFVKMVQSLSFNRHETIQDVDCEGIMNGSKEAIAYPKRKELQPRIAKLVLPDEEIASWTTNCTTFLRRRNYITTPLSLEEEEYPVAYIISLYTNLQAFEHLLRSIYHPQNIYCIHIDEKTDPEFKKRVADIVRCFDNVFLASKMIKVYYTHWSIVQSSLNCMDDLVKLNHSWKYVMNLCAFDYPIKTNLGIVRALKNLDGNNSATTFDLINSPQKTHRYNQAYHLPESSSNHAWLVPTGKKKDPAPHNITIFTGSDYIAFRREAVKYLLTDKKIQDFFEWAEDTLVPDEMVWPTLQRMYPEFPGSEPAESRYDHKEYQAILRFRSWGGKCDGEFIRAICVFGSGDLNRFVNDHHIFANKLGFNVDPVAIECLAEYIRNKTIEDAIG